MGAKSAGTARFVEVERKYDVPESTVFPSFDGIATVARVEKFPAQSMDALYFDTPDHGLARHHITLRRRTGGSDAGWHLKLPAGADARTEVHASLDGGSQADSAEVPAELLDIVAAIARGRAPVPVARIATVRSVVRLYGADGAELAEFADDEVSAWAMNPDGSPGAEQRWHEWELELAHGVHDGGPELLKRLGNRLFDAGAKPAGHGSKLAKVLGAADRQDHRQEPAPPADPVHRAVAEQVHRLLEWDRAVRADADDAVHQMRVTTRQIRSLLQASEAAFGLTEESSILVELRELAGVLGTARDAEVLAERYRDALDSLPPYLVRGPVRERLVNGAWQRYHGGLNRALKAMRSQRYFRLLDALDEVVAAPVSAPDAEHPPATIASSYHRVRKAARAVAAADTAEDHDEALHRIRKAAKRLRYVAAATGDAKVSDRAKAIQSLLGDHQDSVISRTHLLEEVAAAHAAGEDTFTYGVLFQQEYELARRSERELGDALRALRRSVRKS
ncbi:MAG: CHAD domain-containing protein [Mycobacterium sp.]